MSKTITVAWSLRQDLVVQVQLPMDLNQKDVVRFLKLLNLELEVRQGLQIEEKAELVSL